MGNATSLSAACLSLAITSGVLAVPAQLDTADKFFTAQVETQNNRSTIFIRNNTSNKRTAAWTGTAGSVENTVEHGKERVAKIEWSPVPTSDGDRLLLLITEVQRYADVYDPNAIYMFSARQVRLLWSKVLGRRWDESVGWSPRADMIVTVISPVGPEGVRGDACVVMSSASGTDLNTIYVTDLISRGLRTVTDIQNARFLSEDMIRLNLYQKDSNAMTSYAWHFRESENPK